MKMQGKKIRIAIFASGNGSNAENIIRHFNAKGEERCAEVALVVTNRTDARVVTRAKELGVPVETMKREGFNEPEIISAILDGYGINFVVLAGFLLMVPSFLTERYRGRMVNIHPSLLPKYGGKGMYGRHVHEAVVASGDRVTGITVHLVSDGCDEGAVLFQAETPVMAGDSAEDVEARVHGLEKEHFPRVIEEYLSSSGIF